MHLLLVNMVIHKVLEGNKSNTGSPAICACDHTATCESPCSPIIGAYTARFQFFLSREFDVAPNQVYAPIIGEHGDSQVAVMFTNNRCIDLIRCYIEFST
jgi:hypothetical protein